MHLYSSLSDAESVKAYRWRGAPVLCVCLYMYLQTNSQANIVSRQHILPMSVWYDFHWHHFFRNRCTKSCVVALQKTVPLCLDLCTRRLATGGPVHWLSSWSHFFAVSFVFWSSHQHLIHPNRPILFVFAMLLRITQIKSPTTLHWLLPA